MESPTAVALYLSYSKRIINELDMIIVKRIFVCNELQIHHDNFIANHQKVKFNQVMMPWTNFRSLPMEFYEKEDCISSRVRPFVSGTSFTTNSTVKAQTTQNIKKHAASLQEKR